MPGEDTDIPGGIAAEQADHPTKQIMNYAKAVVRQESDNSVRRFVLLFLIRELIEARDSDEFKSW